MARHDSLFTLASRTRSLGLAMECSKTAKSELMRISFQVSRQPSGATSLTCTLAPEVPDAVLNRDLHVIPGQWPDSQEAEHGEARPTHLSCPGSADALHPGAHRNSPATAHRCL